jgi:WD40 repeat protein
LYCFGFRARKERPADKEKLMSDEPQDSERDRPETASQDSPSQAKPAGPSEPQATETAPHEKPVHEDVPWLFPAVIVGTTAVAVLSLALVLAVWGFVRRGNAVPIVGDDLAAAPYQTAPAMPLAEETDPLVSTEPAASYAPRALDAPAATRVRVQRISESSPIPLPAESESSQEPPSDVTESANPAVGSAATARPERREQLAATGGVTVNQASAVVERISADVAPAAGESTVIEAAELEPPSAQPARGPQKSPRPSGEAQARAREQLAASGDLDTEAAATPAAKRTAAERLLERAQQQTDAAVRYVLLDQARTLATEAGDVQVPFAAIEQMDRHYDADTVSLRADVVRQLSSEAKDDPSRGQLARLSIDVGKRAVHAEQFEVAEQMYETGMNFARRLRDTELQQAIRSHRAQLKDMVAASQAAAEAKAALEQQAADPDAHLQLGRYLCFFRDDWEAGLPHLAQGSDAALADTAKQDINAGSEADELVRVADTWYEWAAEAEKQERPAAWRRARDRYRTAKPGLAEPAASRVATRLSELARLLDDRRPEPPETMRLAWLDGPSGEVQTFDGHTENITALSVSGSGSLLASASEDRSVRLWRLPTAERVWTRSTETSNLNALAFSPDEQFVVSNFDNTQLNLWAVSSGEPGAGVPTGARSPAAVAVTPDGCSLLWTTRSRPPNILMWSLTSNQPLARFGADESPNMMDLSRDGKSIVTGDSRGVVRTWDLATGQMLREYRIHNDAVTDLDLSPPGRLVATASFDEIRVTDLVTGETVYSFDVPTARTAAISPDGRRLVSGGFREEVFLWDLTTGQQLPTLRAERAFSDRYILRLAFLPDPRGLVSGASDGKIRLWRLPE